MRKKNACLVKHLFPQIFSIHNWLNLWMLNSWIWKAGYTTDWVA
jgi:hypothetical protein